MSFGLISYFPPQLVVWTDEKPDFTSMISADILPEDYGGKEKPLKQLHGKVVNW